MPDAIRSAALDRLEGTLSEGTPVFMLNLLRFHPDGGRQTYFGGYIAAFRAVATQMGIEGIVPIWMGDVAEMVAGPPEERWDAVLVVRYPSVAAFRTIVESDAYRTSAEPVHRSAVLEWRLIAQTELQLPG